MDLEAVLLEEIEGLVEEWLEEIMDLVVVLLEVIKGLVGEWVED